MPKKWKRIIKYILFTYIASGLLYGIAGYIYRSVIGKTYVFSPLIGIPLDIVGWPWMVYADLKHIGIMPQDIVLLLSVVIFTAIFTIREIRLLSRTR